MRARRFLASLLALAALAGPATARAGGFEYGTDNGAEAVARGGASTAWPGMPSMYTNVAGIADTASWSVLLSTNLCFRHVWFERAGGFGAVEDESPPFPGPMVTATVRLADWVVLGLGAFGPAAVGVATFGQGTAEDPGPARYLLTDMQLAWVWPTVALGFRPPGHPQLRLGFAFQPAFAYLYLRTFGGTIMVDNPTLDVVAELEAWDPFIPAFQLGVLYQIGSRVEVGLAARITDRGEAVGEATASEFPYDAERRGSYEPSDARLAVDLPFMTLRAGVRYRHPRRSEPPPLEDEPPPLDEPPHRAELFDIEVDFVYTTGSTLRDLVLTLDEPVHLGSLGDLALPPVAFSHDWKDTYAVRLGGSLNLLGGDLTLSAGLWWESETVPAPNTHADITTWMSVGLGGGVTYRVGWFEATVAYQHIFMPDREVSLEEGEVLPLRASAAQSTFDEPAVNAGRWRASQDILAVSLAARM